MYDNEQKTTPCVAIGLKKIRMTARGKKLK